MSSCEAQSFVCDSFGCNEGDRHVKRGQGAAAGGAESSPALSVGRGEGGGGLAAGEAS